MKKFLALFLIMAMLLSSFALLSSCNENAVDKAAIKDDPYTILMKASRNTTNNFFVVNKDARKVIENASKKGAYTFKVSDIEDLSVPFEKFSSTVYANADEKNFVIDASATIYGEDYTGSIYMNSNSITAETNKIEKTLKVNFETLLANFENSDLFEMADLDDEDVKEYVDAFTDLFADVKEILAKSYADSIKDANEYIEIFMGELSETTITVDGKKIDAIQMPFTFNTKNIKKYINKIFNAADALDSLEEFEETKQHVLESIDKSLNDSELKLNLYINKETTSFAKITVKAELDIPVLKDETAPIVEGEIFFSDTRIVFKGSATVNKETYGLNAEISKETEGDETTFKYLIKGEGTEKGATVTITLAEGKIEYNNESGKVKFILSVPQAEYSCEIKGTFKTTNDKVTFTAESFSHEYKTWEYTEVEEPDNDYYDEYYDDEYYDDEYDEPISEMVEVTRNEEYKFKIQIIIDSDAKMPSAPNNATDIMNLSEEEWKDIISTFVYGQSEDAIVTPIETMPIETMPFETHTETMYIQLPIEDMENLYN